MGLRTTSNPPSLDAVWPDVSLRVHATLRRRGIGRELAEDVVQETAERVISHRIGFADADDLYRWAVVVAQHLAVDAIRKERRQCQLAPEMPSLADVPNDAISRYWLSAVQRGFAQLPADERAAIVERDEVGDRRAAVRAAVRRHRARAHLMQIAEGLGLGLGWLVSRRPRRTAAAVAMAVTPAVVLISFTVIPHHTPVRSDLPSAGAPRGGAHLIEAVEAPVVRSPWRTMWHTATDLAVAAADGQVLLPDLRLRLPALTNSSDVGGRQKRGNEPLLCVDTALVGRLCVTIPVQLTG